MQADVDLFETTNRNQDQLIELVDEFCHLGCTLKNNGSYERDVQQRCAKATSAFKSLTKCLWSTLITNEVKLRLYLSAIRPIMMYGSKTWAAPSRVIERLDCTERKLLRLLLGCLDVSIHPLCRYSGPLFYCAIPTTSMVLLYLSPP
ncbi:hypothetical protein RB195_013322 [Necator americanus]|uniref:Uncharacterized protein n=1 Tax=Necator americanus TaxID=51031 RepID=A0ABR1DXP9_NECAM